MSQSHGPTPAPAPRSPLQSWHSRCLKTPPEPGRRVLDAGSPQALTLIPLSIYPLRPTAFAAGAAQETEARPMRVLQCTKRSVTLLAAACVALSACGDSGPETPFNPTGTTEDIAAVHDAFSSDAFASFSTLQRLLRRRARHVTAGLGIGRRAQLPPDDERRRAPGGRGAERPPGGCAHAEGDHGSFSASTAAIPAEVAGKTFEYNGTEYVPDRPHRRAIERRPLHHLCGEPDDAAASHPAAGSRVRPAHRPERHHHAGGPGRGGLGQHHIPGLHRDRDRPPLRAGGSPWPAM